MKKIILLISFFPIALFAQDASNMLPQKTVVNDTARQKDLLDLAREWFNIHSNTIRARQEKKVYPGSKGFAATNSESFRSENAERGKAIIKKTALLQAASSIYTIILN